MINKIHSVALVIENFEPILRVVSNNKKDFPLTTGFGVYRANEFMKGLNTGINIKFENLAQYNGLINKINSLLRVKTF